MRRRLFNLAVAVSLTLGVLTTAMWVRGRWRVDRVSWKAGQTSFYLVSGNGNLTLAWFSGWPGHTAFAWKSNSVALDAGDRLVHSSTGTQSNVYVGSFYQGIGAPAGSYTASRQTAPYRMLSMLHITLIALLLIPVIGFAGMHWMRWRLTRAQVARGCCPNCNYDLRATPDRCPECGTMPKLPLNRSTQRIGDQRIL